MTYEEQAREYTRMRQLREADTEQRIRELAVKANERIAVNQSYPNQSYQPFSVVMQLPSEPLGIMHSYDFARNMHFVEIRCDLSPQVAGTPEGQLIAEIIIRDAYDLAKMEQELY